MPDDAAKPTFLDRAIQAVAPAWGFRRAQARSAISFFGYDGASPGRLRGSSGGLHKNAAAESPRMASDRVKIMWDARDMVRNDPLIGGLVDRMVMYICAKLAYQPRTGDPAVDRVYRDYIYAKAEESDLTGRHRLREQAELGLKGMLVDGDHGFAEVRTGNAMKLQHVESDRIGDPLKMIGNTDESYIQGIRINQLGQVVSYDVYRRTRTAQYIFDRTVPADQFVHLAMYDSSDKYRPASMLARVLPHARDLHELIGFEKQAAKFASMFAGFLKPTTGQTGAAAWDEAPKPGELGKINAEAGLVKQIPAGYGDIEFAPGVNRPSGAFMNLFETVIRLVAAGLRLPYGFVWDMAVFGGVTARIELVQVDRAFARYRQLLVDKLLERWKNKTLALGIALREIPATQNWKAGKWNFGGKLTGDYGHDTTADLAKLAAGITTETNLCDQDGEEFEEVARTSATQMKFLQQLASEYGVPIELITQRFPNASQLLAAINTPPAPPPKDLLSQKGDTATKQLIEILSGVGEGTTDPESAVEQIVNIFGVPRGKAEAMVPQRPGPSARFGRMGDRKLAVNGRQGNGRR